MVRGQWANLASIQYYSIRLHPYSFWKDILGFLMTTESQDLGLISHPNDGAFYSIPSLHWGVTFTFTFTFTFSHLADTFIQSDLQLGST